jgi:hypothetical protein
MRIVLVAVVGAAAGVVVLVVVVMHSISSQRASVASYHYADPSSPILVALMIEAIRSSETSVLTRAIQRNITEDSILHSHLREDLKF